MEDAESDTQTSRKQSEIDRDYKDGKQWTSDETSKIKKRGQPVITTNIILGKIETLKGIELQQRNKPLGLPRNIDHDKEAAEASTDAIRFVTENNQYLTIRSSVWDNMIIEGFGGIELSIDLSDEKNPKIGMDFIPWDRLGYDPASARDLFNDAKFKYQIIWMDLNDAVVKWPNKKEELELALSNDNDSDTYGDKPDSTGWHDSKRKRVRVAKMYYHEGEVWYFITFTEGSTLESGKVPFVDDEGKSYCPLIMASGYIDRENKRFGQVRNMRSPQEMINKFRSKATHSMSVNRIRVDPRAKEINSIETIRAEYAKPDGVIVAQKDEVEDLSNAGVTQANVVLLGEVKAELNDMGANRSLQGSEQRDLSGRAERLRQNAGLLTLASYLDTLRSFDIEVYSQTWFLIRQFWTEEKWVRVTDDENNVKFVGLNKTMTNEDFLKQKLGEVPSEFLNDPVLKEPFLDEDGKTVKMNVPADIGLDIILEQGVNSATLGEEQFDKLAAMGDIIPPEILLPAMLRNSDIIGADDMIDAIEGNDVDPQVAQQQQQDAEIAKEIQIESAMSQIDKTNSETEKNLTSSALNEAKVGETNTQSVLNMSKAQSERQTGDANL